MNAHFLQVVEIEESFVKISTKVDIHKLLLCGPIHMEKEAYTYTKRALYLWVEKFFAYV